VSFRLIIDLCPCIFVTKIIHLRTARMWV
jgi:hypothetical protein